MAKTGVYTMSVADYLALHPEFSVRLAGNGKEKMCQVIWSPRTTSASYPFECQNYTLEEVISGLDNALLQQAQELERNAFILGVNYVVVPFAYSKSLNHMVSEVKSTKDAYATGIPAVAVRR